MRTISNIKRELNFSVSRFSQNDLCFISAYYE